MVGLSGNGKDMEFQLILKWPFVSHGSRYQPTPVGINRHSSSFGAKYRHVCVYVELAKGVGRNTVTGGVWTGVDREAERC